MFGALGMLAVANPHPTTLTHWTAEGVMAEPVHHHFLERYPEAYRLEMDHFVDAVANGRPLAVGAGDGREALRIAEAAVESLRTGRAVRVHLEG